MSSSTTITTRRLRLSCAHQHRNPELSQAENHALFHKCSAIHGHEYKIEVSEISSSGPRASVSMGIEGLAGRFLNDFVGNTSGERIGRFFWDRGSPGGCAGVVLRETRKNSFFVRPVSTRKGGV